MVHNGILMETIRIYVMVSQSCCGKDAGDER